MSYIDGFVIAVPAENRDKFIEHARTADPVFTELGATRVVECWEDDVPDGERTDFRRAVAAEPGEKIAFAWIEWPDKATRDAAVPRTTEMMATDPRLDPARNPMPFDGKRMIYGGFAPLVDGPADGATGYADGFVTPVSPDKREAYRDMAEKAAAVFREHGALRSVECWGDDVPDGKVTDFRRAVSATDGEAVVFSFLEWPDKAARDEGWKKVMADPRMQPDPATMPFDGKRMFWGGFTLVVQL